MFLQLYKDVYASVAAGIRCDVRNNDVLPPYMSSIEFTISPTTMCLYNIETKLLTIFHFTHNYAFQNFPFHFPPICGDTSIVQYLYCDVAHTRPLPTPGLFPIFSFSHQKTPQEFLVVSLLRLPQIHCHHDGSCTSGIVSAIPL